MTHRLALATLAAVLGLATDCPGDTTPPTPTRHVEQSIEGWTVHVDERLLKGPDADLGKRALQFLAMRLVDIKLAVPPDKVARLQQVPIWLDRTHGKLKPAQYHPSVGWLKGNGYDPRLAKCVHIPDASGFASPGHQRVQPWSVLHELAHAYHDQVLGFNHAAIAAAWARFKAGGKYEKVLHINGQLTRHYALTNPQEFFAEMSEAYFGTNDFFPFNRAELRREEPEIYALMEQLWRGKRSTAGLPVAKGAYVATGSLASPFANQAAAADERFVYAVDNSVVAKYDRATGKEFARSKGKAQHLNSGFLWQGKLYCAHSNYPRQPHQSDIRVLDPESIELTIYHTFTDPPGSLTWAVRRGDHWWCHFAHYGKDKDKSVLVRYDARWHPEARWTFPPELVADWGNHSLSGGLWDGDRLLATGHDKKVVYRLRVPDKGKVVEVIDVVPSPFPGQGIATDLKTSGLVGIDRGKREVIFARFEAR